VLSSRGKVVMRVRLFRAVPKVLLAVLCALTAGLTVVASAALAASEAPVVSGEEAASVGAEEVTVKAKVNPNAAATTFHFEYGTGPSYGTTAPIPDGNVGAGSEPVTVVWTLTGLKPGSAYHFRVAASNASGTAIGADQAFRTYASTEASGQSCANAEIRGTQFSAYLPDCRAYELVSPPDKSSADIAAWPGHTQSSLDGNAIKYFSRTSFGDSEGSETSGSEYISQRATEGWATHAINPEETSAGAYQFYTTPRYLAMAPDLTKGAFFALTPITSGHPNTELVANLYLRGNLLTDPMGGFELLSDAPTPQPPRPLRLAILGGWLGVSFGGASADWSHILVETYNNLTTQTTGDQTKLYDWYDGSPHLAGILPNGEPAEESVAGNGAGGSDALVNQNYEPKPLPGAISADGSRIVFTGPPTRTSSSEFVTSGNLYMRIDDERTIQLNASERSEPDPNGPQPAEFWGASSDGSKVFFTSREMLTNDAPEPGRDDLYMYDMNAAAGKHLTLLSVNGQATQVVGMSENGSYVYFVGGPEDEYLYVWHDGSVRFITKHRSHAYFDYWGPDSTHTNGFRTTPDGRFALFTSGESNPYTAQQAGVRPCEVSECVNLFVYNYEANQIVCASCNPSGAPTTSPSIFESHAFNVPAVDMYLNRPISDDGRYVLFDTEDALLPQDTNNSRDVYEYDTVTRRVSLISGGTCSCRSVFADMSPDGRNVFFTTVQRLVRADFDTNSDMYDARVEGGIAAQNQAPPVPCSGDDCQGPVESAPLFSAPASAAFAGVGNLVPTDAKPAAQHTRKTKKNGKKAAKRKRRHAKAMRGKKAKRSRGRSLSHGASRRGN
jgi:hypothetical protein